MTELIGAYTAVNGDSYPEYFNATRDGDEVVITVREAPTIREDSTFICGFARDRGKPGRCTPGDACCNNYCNMAPEKGPMQDHPAKCRRVFEGKSLQMRMPLTDWLAIVRESGSH